MTNISPRCTIAFVRHPKGAIKMNIPEILSVVDLYIDPSAVTVAISSISGIAIALGAGIAIWWTKAKKKAAEKLHIDPNAHKEVEDELVINSEDTVSADKTDNDKD